MGETSEAEQGWCHHVSRLSHKPMALHPAKGLPSRTAGARNLETGGVHTRERLPSLAAILVAVNPMARELTTA